MKLLVFGWCSCLDVLVEGGCIGVWLCLGVVFMLLVVVFIEVFWLLIVEVLVWGKFSVVGVLWVGVLLWLWCGGCGGGNVY